MDPGMSNKRNSDSSNDDRKAIDDWMYGDGGKVLGGVLIVIVLWFIVTRFW
jgi:uncharacterized protein YegJ (DUF2314 family)